MNYSKGLNPSSMSNGEYEAENRRTWFSLKEHPPSNGKPVVVLHMNGELDPDFWTMDIAYFCNGEFYNLEYDPHLDILRKVFVTEPVEYWAEIVYPCRCELK